jgi:hypothetical protein
MWIYKFMYFEHNFMNIDAVIIMPDTNQIEMSREKNLTSDNNIRLKATFEVHTYYPAFRKDRVNAVGYPRSYGSGMTDLNGYSLAGGTSEFFEQPGNQNSPYDYIGGQNPSIDPQFGSVGGSEYSSGTSSFYNQNPLGQGAAKVIRNGKLVNDPDYYMIAPKRTRWFNNILRSRERTSTPITNPNAGPPSRANEGDSEDPNT